ncbi:MAG: acetylxylan esterase [Verrucomicrobiales bacterium]|nr:acetylxylan esterase [Verrucomicrobiales bacterium]
MIFRLLLTAALFTILLKPNSIASEEHPLSVRPNPEMMNTWLEGKCLEALDRRIEAYEKLKTIEQLETWQRERKEFFLRNIGGLPEERSPLNPVITGKADFDGYSIEKLYFESQPGFFVSATMYLPDGEGPFPGVLHIPGHSTNGKARDLYQRAAIVIAKGGCAVLSYDPVGQGERHHFHDDTREEGQPKIASTTQEHMLFNQGALLLGSNTARLMIWDATRAIDYLQSRDDIIADKIGCTGISGGGTNTSYIMALDDRIVAAAPGCYLCGFRSLINRQGPQDAEQNIHGQIAFGMDHGDYVMMRAPKPTLVMAATQDYFDIEGAWRLFRRSKRFYTRMGFPERCEIVEPDTPHGFPTEMRVASANWMRRWLLGNDTPVTEEDFPILQDEELYSTPTGRVLDLPGAKSSFDIHAEWAESFAKVRAENARPENRDSLRKTVFSLTGARSPEQLPAPAAESINTETLDFANVEKLAIKPEPGIDLPALLFTPLKDSEIKNLIIHLDPAGKHLAATADGAIGMAMKNPGTAVLAVDLRGFGETATPSTRSGFDKLIGADWRETTYAMLLDKSYVGMRVDDIVQCISFVRGRLQTPDLSIKINAIGDAAVPTQHAAFLHPGLIDEISLTDALPNWIDIVKKKYPIGSQANYVFGALRHYDLPHLQTE